MTSAGAWRGTENALSMASCNPIELFSFGPSDCGWNRLVSTTGDAGGSYLTASGERGGDVTKVEGGSGEVEFPGVGSCECSSAICDKVLAVGVASSRDLRVDSRALNLHHMRTCVGLASRPSAHRSYGTSVASPWATCSV